MSIVRFQPFRDIEDIQRQMNHLFDDMMNPSIRKDVGQSFMPAAELSETEQSYSLKLEVPGLTPENIDIEVTAESVYVSGERRSESQTEESGRKQTEFRYGKFQRVLPLPGRIDHQNVNADYTNGILTLTLPKAEEEKNRIVKVNVN